MIMQHSLFLLNSASDLKDAKNAKKMAIELFMLCAFLFVSVKMENVFTTYVFGPLFKRIFGDMDELKRKIELEEQQMKRALDQPSWDPRREVESNSIEAKKPLSVIEDVKRSRS